MRLIATARPVFPAFAAADSSDVPAWPGLGDERVAPAGYEERTAAGATVASVATDKADTARTNANVIARTLERGAAGLACGERILADRRTRANAAEHA
jgi:hypothetical protein